MNKRKKRSSEKQFLQTMIITGVLGISIMIIVTLYMIKLFAPKKIEQISDKLSPIIQEKEDVQARSISGVIHHIDSRNKNIILWDIQEDENIKMQIKARTQIQDSYGKPMSKQEIQIGDIVEITYERNSKDVTTIQKSAKAWERRDIINPEINDQNKTIKIGNKQYEYTSDIFLINEQLEPIDISEIDPFDTLIIKGLNNTIWSIQVLQSPGYIKLSNMPTTDGTLEIGNNTIYRLGEIQDNISLPAGTHKIVVRMKGYQPFADNINIMTGQVYNLDLKDIKGAIASLTVKVTNTQTNYKVEIDNKTYKKGEVIKVKPGEYTLKLTADDFNTVLMTLTLEEGEQNINIKLEAKKENPNPQPENLQPENPQPENPKVEKPKTEKPSTNQPVEEVIKTVQIIIESDPVEAQVFIGGVYKGTTPALTGLRPGEYSIAIEKEGYSTLYSTIVIDASNAQKGFLYTLQKE